MPVSAVSVRVYKPRRNVSAREVVAFVCGSFFGVNSDDRAVIDIQIPVFHPVGSYDFIAFDFYHKLSNAELASSR